MSSLYPIHDSTPKSPHPNLSHLSHQTQQLAYATHAPHPAHLHTSTTTNTSPTPPRHGVTPAQHVQPLRPRPRARRPLQQLQPVLIPFEGQEESARFPLQQQRWLRAARRIVAGVRRVSWVQQPEREWGTVRGLRGRREQWGLWGRREWRA